MNSKSLVVAASALLHFSQASFAEKAQPNIILILADDLGYGDLSCYGATKIQTPNIDRLAKEGMKMSDAHSAASLCSPSRYGVMTGRAPWRLQKKGNGYRLEEGQVTMASFLKEQGYVSAAIGKWHLGYSKDWNKLPITGPLEVGFDYHFGVPQNHNDSSRAFIENHDLVGRKEGEDFRIVEGKDFPEGLAEPRIDDQVDTTLTNKAVDFIHKNAKEPFFLYFTPCAPHTHVTPAEEFRGTSQAGLYGDHIQELDAHVGTILKTLAELELTEKTLVIFTSDNGSTPKDFRGTNNVNLNLASDAGEVRKKFKTAKADAKAMGHVTNGVYRDGKGYPYEGGHRIPFIARWPGKIAAGSESDATLALTDLFATAAGILGKELPQEAAEDSFSILPVLLGEGKLEREVVFIQGDGKDDAIAVCSGQWKLIAQKAGPELYDLSQDPNETTNLATLQPKIVIRLQSALAKAEADGRTRP